ncbi:hypothetical protein SCUP234_08033 [Seiridium cupressi]
MFSVIETIMEIGFSMEGHLDLLGADSTRDAECGQLNMAPLELRKTVDNENWERLGIFHDLLGRSISLQHNGSTLVTMTENSLFNLMTAREDEFLEIAVSKVSPITPMVQEVYKSSKVPHISPARTGSSFLDHIDPNASDSNLISREQRTSIRRNTEGGRTKGGRPRSKITLDTRMFLPLPDTICGNCKRPGHTVRDCVGPVDEHGEIYGCPKCNTARSHIYDSCTYRDSTEDFDFIYRYRQRKPPIKSFMKWQSFLSAHYQAASWPKFIPWSAKFAAEQQESALKTHRKPEWVYYEYDRIGWPDAEAYYREIDPESEFLVL